MTNSVRLGDIAKIYSGGTPSRTNPSYWNGSIPWVKTAQIQNCVISEEDIDEWITEEGLKNSSAKMVPEGTILMAMYGQGKTRGQVAILGVDASINQACSAIELDENANRDFVYQQLLFKYKSIRSLSNTGSQENLSSGLIKGILVTIPSLTEQTAIADLLTTWDEVIEKTERLIEAKEKRFGSLMFSLIHKHRKDWQHKNLSRISEIKKGEQLNRTELRKNGDYPAWNGGVTPSGYTDKWNTPENTITISEGGNSCGFVNYSDCKFWCGGHCYALINLSEDISTEYLYFYLKAHEKRIMRLRVGSGLPNIQRKDLGKFIVHYPDKSRQKSIADTLDLAGKEIKLLNKQAEYFRAQKRGLMQRLLTGKWRININREVNKI